jgi:hypothetical protein
MASPRSGGGAAPVKLRHTLGDVGPWTVDGGECVGTLRARAVAEWPSGARRGVE